MKLTEELREANERMVRAARRLRDADNELVMAQNEFNDALADLESLATRSALQDKD